MPSGHRRARRAARRRGRPAGSAPPRTASVDRAAADAAQSVSVTGDDGDRRVGAALARRRPLRRTAARSRQRSGRVVHDHTSASAGHGREPGPHRSPTACSPPATTTSPPARDRSLGRGGTTRTTPSLTDAGRRRATSRGRAGRPAARTAWDRRSASPAPRRRRSPRPNPPASGHVGRGEESLDCLRVADQRACSRGVDSVRRVRRQRARRRWPRSSAHGRAAARRRAVPRGRRGTTSSTSSSTGRSRSPNRSIDGRESVVVAHGARRPRSARCRCSTASAGRPRPGRSRRRGHRDPLRPDPRTRYEARPALLWSVGRAARRTGSATWTRARRLRLPRRHRPHRQAAARAGRRGATSSCCRSPRRSWPAWSAHPASG